ncbi:MAG: hypothetical protein KAR06_07165, partial [Deltaproteobacteria bacterium]|nr:hypothetical protein [Deltaproteobacteria bacterium]
MRKTLLLAVVAISAFALVMTSATPSEAVHAGSGQLACGQCHTMHSSQGDTNMGDVGGTGSDILLRSAKVYELCLSCHGTAGSASTDTFANDVGTPITPPKVWTQNLGNWGGKDFVSGIGAGGDFDYTGTTDGAGQITAYYAGDDPASNESLGY